MAILKYDLRKDHKNPTGEQGIIIKYNATGEKSPWRLSTGVYVRKEFFHNGVITDPNIPDATRLEKQAQVNALMKSIKSIIKEFQEEGISEPLAKDVKAKYIALSSKKEEVRVIEVKKVQLHPFEAFQKFIDESESGERLTAKGKRISKGHVNNYKSTLNFLKDFEQETGYKITWDTINFKFYQAVCYYCFDVKGYFDNNTGRYIKQLKTFLNYCVDEEIIPTPLYNKKWITYKEDEVDSFSLYPHEVLILDGLTSEQLKGCIKGEETRDLLMLSIFTCLRVSDLMKLNKYAFRNFDGSYTVDLVQTKTIGKLTSLPLPAIANKYVRKLIAGEIKPISDQYYNRNLKVFARWLIRHIQKERKTYERKGYILNDIWLKTGHPEGLNPEKNKDKVYFPLNRKRRSENVVEYIELHEAFSSHMGRRTGITMYLIQGESTIEVMKRSGHKTLNQLMTYENMANNFIGKRFDWSAFHVDKK